MWIRMFFLAAGVVLMITGCNSLISQFFGTHQLRSLQLEEATQDGLGDADFVRLEDVTLTKTYLRGAPLHDTDKPIVIYPILSPEQVAAHLGGEEITIHFLGWSTVYDLNCYEREDCYRSDLTAVQGLVRPPNPRKTPSAENWKQLNYVLADDASYLQVGREPMAWYWNLLLFVGGISLPVMLEARAFRKRQQ